MDVSFYVNHLIHLVLSIIVQNQGNSVGCDINCDQVLWGKKFGCHVLNLGVIFTNRYKNKIYKLPHEVILIFVYVFIALKTFCRLH